ncbi:MAG: hypothetical protein IKR04_08070 [Clostridia bacterium]|nr:hypothetical protein [Clostridia bacterium]
MLKEGTNNLNANSTTLLEDLLLGVAAFFLLGLFIIAALLPVQLIANFFGVGA